MKVKKRGDEHWILGVDGMDPEGMGPYPSKEEAEYIIARIEDMWKYGDRPGFVTVDKAVKREPIVLVPRVEEPPPPPKRRARSTAVAVPATGRRRRKSRKRR
jgi:hypothetical protein